MLYEVITQLPPYTETDEKKILIRRRDKEILKKRLAQLTAGSPEIQRQLEETAAEFNNPSAANFPAFHVITSYSIHYTKLYDTISARARPSPRP